MESEATSVTTMRNETRCDEMRCGGLLFGELETWLVDGVVVDRAGELELQRWLYPPHALITVDGVN